MTSQANKPLLSFQSQNSSTNLRSLLVKNQTSNPNSFHFFDHQTPQKKIKSISNSPNTQMDSKSPNDNSTLDVQSSGQKDSDCERSDPVRNIWDTTANLDCDRSNDSNSNSKDEPQNMACILGNNLESLGYPPNPSLIHQLEQAHKESNGDSIVKQEYPFEAPHDLRDYDNQQGMEDMEDPSQMISILMQMGISEGDLAQLGIIQTGDGEGDKVSTEPNPELLMSILQKYGLLQEEGVMQENSNIGPDQSINVKDEAYEEQEQGNNENVPNFDLQGFLQKLQDPEEVELLVEGANMNNQQEENKEVPEIIDLESMDINNMMSNLFGSPDQLNNIVNMLSNGNFSDLQELLGSVNNQENGKNYNGNGYRNNHYSQRNSNQNFAGNRFNRNNNHQYRENTNPYNRDRDRFGGGGGGNMNRNREYNSHQREQRENGPRSFHYSALDSQHQKPSNNNNNNNFKRKVMTGNSQNGVNNKSLTINPNTINYSQRLNHDVSKGNFSSQNTHNLNQNKRRLNQQNMLRTPPSTTKSRLKTEKLLGIPLNELSAHRSDYDDDTIVVTMNNEQESMLEPHLMQLHKEPALRAHRRKSGDSDIEEGEILVKKKRKLSPNYTDKIYSNINSVLQNCEENLKNAKKSFLNLIPGFDFDHPEKYLE